MRTTVNIDEDVLVAVRGIAEQRNLTMGQVLSLLARQALKPKGGGPELKNGVPLLPLRGDPQTVTPDLVNALRDDDSQ